MGGRSRSRLGQPDREFAGSRWRIFDAAISESFRFALRNGSGAGQWRSAAHGNGRAAGREDVAGIQIRVRSVDRWNFFAIEFRSGDENGILADAGAGLVFIRHIICSQARRSDSAGGNYDAPRGHARHHRNAGTGKPAAGQGAAFRASA